MAARKLKEFRSNSVAFLQTIEPILDRIESENWTLFQAMLAPEKVVTCTLPGCTFQRMMFQTRGNSWI